MNIGYARVSTEEQNGNGQVAELKKVCDLVELEYASGGRWDRPCLQNILRGIKAGDVLVVWKLDRLTRSLSDLLNILKTLEERGAGSLPRMRRSTSSFCTPFCSDRTAVFVPTIGEIARTAVSVSQSLTPRRITSTDPRVFGSSV